MAGFKKVYKTVERENGIITIYGSNRDIKTFYAVPDWNKDKDIDADDREELAFRYRGHVYYFSEFMAVHNSFYNPNPPEWMKEFTGYMGDSYFSGVLIKISDDGETIKAYTYIS